MQTKRYTSHYITNQHQKIQYRFWVDNKPYQCDPGPDGADYKLSLGYKVEKFNKVTGQWEAYKG